MAEAASDHRITSRPNTRLLRLYQGRIRIPPGTQDDERRSPAREFQIFLASGPNDPGGRAVGQKVLPQGCTIAEQGALIKGPLVGDLVEVERGLLVQGEAPVMRFDDPVECAGNAASTRAKKPGAEMANFDGMTFADVHGGKEILVVTTPSPCEFLAKRMQERRIKPEREVFGPQHILQDVTRPIEKGYDKLPYHINLVLGADKGSMRHGL